MIFRNHKSLMARFILILTLMVAMLGEVSPKPVVAAPGDTILISSGSFLSPPQGNNSSYGSSISGDGRYVAFQSYATNLASGDTNSKQDIFVFDRQAGLAERVSVDSNGGQANGNSYVPSISSNGRYVAFYSDATNLVSGDTNGGRDVFIHDLETGITERLSVVSTGSGDAGYVRPAISADGRYVAFGSGSNGLVSEDTNGMDDIFVVDRQTGLTERVSIAPGGAEANGPSFTSSLSADGRYVVFGSTATNLVSDDTNDAFDTFVFDRQTRLTERVSVDSSGTEANSYSDWASISADGRYVTFNSGATNLVSGDSNNEDDAFVHDRQTGVTERVSVDSNGLEGDYNSYDPSISSDGRYIAFASYARNLVSDDTNNTWDVFVHDRITGITQRVSVASNGAEGKYQSDSPSISGDGRYVSFDSDAQNLASTDLNSYSDIFVHDCVTAETESVSLGPVGMGSNQGSYLPSVSGDGRYVGFYSAASNLVSGDTNSAADIFVHDGQTGITERVSISSSNVQANNGSVFPSISGDGRYVAFVSGASNLVDNDTNNTGDIFIHDRQTGTTERVSVDSSGGQANSNSYAPSISTDGRYVAFESYASNLVSGDKGVEDVFVHDIQTGVTERISNGMDEVLANNTSNAPVISGDGRFVAFRSRASNLVNGDTNNTEDIFVCDRQTGITERVSVDSKGVQANNSSSSPAISADGRYVSFVSTASNLVSDDTNGVSDIFVHDRQMGVTKRVSVDSSGAGANSGSNSAAISRDGRYVAFASGASNLVDNDTNNLSDIFIHDLQTSLTQRVTVNSNKEEANDSSSSPSLTANGQFVAFSSNASNLVSNDGNYSSDIFLHEYDFPPTILSIVRAGADNTSAARVDFTVSYTEPVKDVDTNDFLLDITGPLSGAFIENVIAVDPCSTLCDTYTITVNTGSGNGTIRLDVPTDATIRDQAGKSLAGLPFLTGEGYTVKKFANVNVYIEGELRGNYALAFHESIRQSYKDVNSGAVKIKSMNGIPLISSARVIYKAADNVPTSFSELMALPESQLDNTYWLPWYNNVDLDTQLRFGNVSGSTAYVRVFIGGQEMAGSPFQLIAGQSTRVNFAGINNGPLQIQSDQPIVAAERVIYKANGLNTSFAEVMALPNSQLANTYWLPWYNNVDLDSQLRIGNLSGSPATIHIFIGGTEVTPVSGIRLSAGASTRLSYPGVNNGPVKIQSDHGMPIVASERVIYKVNGTNTSFTEMMALPDSQLNTVYWLPWYNNVDLDTQLRVGNTSDVPATVHMYIGGREMTGSPFLLQPGKSTRQSFPSIHGGPVKIESNQPIVASERVVYKTTGGIPASFSEMMALPNSQLDTTFWLPWYNNTDLDTQLRFSVP